MPAEPVYYILPYGAVGKFIGNADNHHERQYGFENHDKSDVLPTSGKW